MPQAPTALSHLQRALMAVRQREIIECRQTSPTALYRSAARLFLPSDGRRRILDPFPPVGKMMTVVLSRRPVIDGPMNRDQVYLRGFKAHYDTASGLTLWDEQTAIFGYDVALPSDAEPADAAAVLSPRKVELLQAAIDLNRACAASHRGCGRLAVLPPTLLAIPSGFTLEPEPTPFVRIRAALDRSSISEAWYKLVATFRVPAEQTGMDADLVDSRLIHEQACLSLSEHHDLRAFLGRAISNPVRTALRHPFPQGQRVMNVLRSRMRADVAAVCSDEDLRRALLNPTGPLIASGLSTIQTWRPPLTRRACDAFQFEEAGVRADLWTTPWKWVDAVVPRVVRGAAFTSYQRPALCA